MEQNINEIFIKKIASEYGVKIFIDTEKLFFFEHTEKLGFKRYDLLVKLLALESYYAGEDSGFDLYLKMKRKTDAKNLLIPEDEFYKKQLISSFQRCENTDINLTPLFINYNFEIVSNDNIYVFSLYNDIKTIPAIISLERFNHRVFYTLDWFAENGFTEAELAKIQDKYQEIKKRYQKNLLGIIWPPAYRYRDEIVKYFSSKFLVTSTHDLDLKDKDTFGDFIRDIYEKDDIERWKIQVKYNHMVDYGYKCRIFTFVLGENDYMNKNINGIILPFSKSANEAKLFVRDSFERVIEDYFFDIALHISDNDFEYDAITEVVFSKYQDYFL